MMCSCDYAGQERKMQQKERHHDMLSGMVTVGTADATQARARDHSQLFRILHLHIL
jgi:hypothetical protein